MYIEYVIVDNLVIDGLILILTSRAANLRAKWWQVFLSALVGTATSVCFPLFHLSSALLLTVKIMLSAVMTLILCARKLKKFIKAALYFYAFTLVLGGGCFAVLYFLGDVAFGGTGIRYHMSVPVGVVVLGISLASFGCFALIAHIKKVRRIGRIACSADISAGGETIRVSGIIDSGNLLIDPDTGRHVAVVDEECLAPLLDKGKLRCKHDIKFNTVSGANAKITVFLPDKFLFYYMDNVHILNDVMVGISTKRVFGKDCKILMPLVET